MNGPDPSSAEFFDATYRDATDPWGFETDPYELARYDAIADHVDPARHHHAFEPGCSIGVLTERLARRCATVDATDLSAHAVRRAQERCRDLAGVHIEVGGLRPPRDHYDLVVLSEIGYYLGADELRDTTIDLARRVGDGGRVIAAHWIGTSPDHRLHGDDVHAVLAAALDGWQHVTGDVHHHPTRDGYRLDVWDRP